MQFTISLPDWAEAELAKLPTYLPTLAERMTAVIRFSRLNIEHNTGGPFAAGLFERDSGRLVVIGVNRVVPQHCSSAHAEVVTLSLAQQKLGTFDLGGPGLPAYQLVVNWRPCAMCYGAVVWSGIRSLAIAGSGPELETITGFDEGPIHPHWQNELEKRGIEVIDGVLTDQAIAVFEQFRASGALVYNGRLGSTP
ncbi:MAG TPA: nucleoside deaminase [Chloroflexota bacterium]|nr:nucleoside deaminase [Chloroflexota bacterium]